MYTQKFQRLLDQVSRVDERGKDIAESTRLNMAIYRLQQTWGSTSPQSWKDDERPLCGR